ncbi:hypothetical protein TWF569_009178 [Orbilia oligospora]|uniref:DUF1640-domain-containing protein n=1 Tax=Orbilia oligospora TaxID=2813651 RepID=A0A7C8PA00_ORBOL|nr:hypothetical protein TWF706_001710 [Orbilia oligospora]KAF3100831.1 hypothetical protein TWF103_008137 [Orbilia oligospora]KAF3103183.1 hypothetical protein TWF102_003996 [Orbilia oligospora]KAF3127875.1 hypothetical protein TWF594_000538 [Orbilia oligospora]KAF3137477.1 hypothetical protein TWF569_009178 [Orbilia oligospora]
MPSARHISSLMASRRALSTVFVRPTSQPLLPFLYPSARGFSSTPPLRRDHHFDTLKFVERLKSEGFTETQSVAIMRVLSDAIEESIQNLSQAMVLKEEQEKVTYAQKVDFAKLRHDLSTTSSSELLQTSTQYEHLTSEIDKLRSRLREEINRTQANVRLDLNLEKGRIREESSVHELKIKETDTRIETELSQARAQLESVKFSTLQWLIGVTTGTSAIILGVWRLLM